MSKASICVVFTDVPFPPAASQLDCRVGGKDNRGLGLCGGPGDDNSRFLDGLHPAVGGQAEGTSSRGLR